MHLSSLYKPYQGISISITNTSLNINTNISWPNLSLAFNPQNQQMESFKTQNHNLVLLLLIFISSSLLLSATNALTAPAGQVERATKQQLLASIPPNHEPTPTGSSQLFLTSPSGKYAVFLMRRETSLGAGGFGSDFCYLQVQDSGESVWESECAPVSNVNTCSVMFTDAGLEIFDGSTSAWDNDVDGENLEILELLDSGDMVIRDRDGEQVWKASDNPIINQNCGSIGAPGMAPALPPFASPIHDGKGPFGQPARAAHGVGNPNHGTGELAADHGVGVADAPQEVGVADAPQEEGQQQLGVPHEHEAGLNSNHQSSLSGAGLNGNQQQPLTSVNQPLLDNTPFDSGSFKVEVASLVSIVGVLGCFGFLL